METMQPKPCPKCHDARYLRQDLPVGHPQFGKPVLCSCMQQKLAEKQQARLETLADLPEEMTDCTFVTFDTTCDPTAYRAARAFVDGVYPDGRPAGIWLYLEGNTGTGKTHLLAAIAHQLLEAKQKVLFRNVPRLLDWLKEGFSSVNNPEDSFQWRFDAVCQVPVLLLDDLGAQYTTAWVQERLYMIMNYRYTHRLRTAFSTNDSVNDLDDRVRSRICDRLTTDLVQMTAADYRTRQERRRRRLVNHDSARRS